MNMNRFVQNPTILVLAGIGALLLNACASVPQQLQGEYVSLTPEDVSATHREQSIRWGGVVLETRPESDHTCFEILSRQLNKSMQPVNSDQSGGRFIACKPGFYDPEVFEKGREVTLTGTIVNIDIRKVGEYDYKFPIVDIKFLSLWPKRRDVIYRDYWGPYRSHYWYYPHYWPYYRYPF